METHYVDWVQTALEQNFKIDTVIRLDSHLPQEAFYSPRGRYRADSLIRYLKRNYEADKVIGITSSDISTTSNQHPDWGIMGLAFLSGKSCVVSTFRTFRNTKSEEHKKHRLQKVSLHEFGHTLGIPHCKDSKTCVMRDAEGKVSTVDDVDEFCESCQSKISKYLHPKKPVKL